MAKRKRFTAEQIIPLLREAEVELARGRTVAQVCKKIGVTEQTYYRWRKEYGSLRMYGRLNRRSRQVIRLGQACWEPHNRTTARTTATP